MNDNSVVSFLASIRKTTQLECDISHELNKGFKHLFANKGVHADWGEKLDVLLDSISIGEKTQIINGLASVIRVMKEETDANIYLELKMKDAKIADLEETIKKQIKHIEDLTYILED
jgi:hypothetical protein